MTHPAWQPCWPPSSGPQWEADVGRTYVVGDYPLAAFMTNPAGAAIVDTTGPIRQIVQSNVAAEKRYLVIARGTAVQPDAVVQV